MNGILDMYYRGYRSGIYTLPEAIRLFSRQEVFGEDLEGKGYDPKFVAALPRKDKVRGKIEALKPEVIKPSMHIRHSLPKDELVLEELSQAFQQELYNNSHKEDFLGLDALVLLTGSLEGDVQGALWYQILDEKGKGELYIRSLYVRSDFRGLSAGKSLVEFACEDFAENQGCLRVGVNSPDHRTSFYRNLGFHRVRSNRETEGCVYLVRKIEL